MANELYQFLSEDGVRNLAEQLLGKLNIRVQERIVTEINENSSDKQVLSAKALYNLINTLNTSNTGILERLDEHDAQLSNNGEALAEIAEEQTTQNEKILGLETDLQSLMDTVNSLIHLKIETVTGSIDTVAEPKTDVMYLQRDDENDKTWMMYIYNTELGWINIGDTEVDLSNYWSKDNIQELREALGIHDAEPIPDEKIVAAVEAAFANTVVDLTDNT